MISEILEAVGCVFRRQNARLICGYCQLISIKLVPRDQLDSSHLPPKQFIGCIKQEDN